ncbi:MAG: argininosuccinate lyase [Verrucomicrobia bacterium]|nr:argininosuccinate lyase [Verrucomicrobiota bacterium]
MRAAGKGRFQGKADPVAEKFGRSVHFDQRLALHDLEGSRAHAAVLVQAGVLSRKEAASIRKGLDRIEKEIRQGKFRWKDSLEDVHMNIEAALTARVPAGAKLHTGRSRNDQVATDMRLWLRETIQGDLQGVAALQRSLVQLGARYREVILPGYTHLQRGQPVLLAHHLLAYVEMLERDKGRLRDALRRTDVLPLGSGALAGSTLRLNREWAKRILRFRELSTNSMDAVSDRDFLVEYLASVALGGVHLSRLAEDLILFSTSEFGFLRFGEAFTTGSSLMPQKRNPDMAELVRGKSGRLTGHLVSLLTTLKGLPLTYNRDLQEDKEAVFDAADTWRNSLEVMARAVASIEVDAGACLYAASAPELLATDVADALVKAGMPFRKAHQVVGAAVRTAEEKGTRMDRLEEGSWVELTSREWKAVSEVLHRSSPSARLRQALQARQAVVGAPSLAGVHRELRRWQKELR